MHCTLKLSTSDTVSDSCMHAYAVMDVDFAEVYLTRLAMRCCQPLSGLLLCRRTPNVCLRLEQTIAALFPLQHQARMKDLLPPPPPPAVSKPSLMSFLLDQFWSSLSLPSSAPVAQVYAAPPPAAPPSEASDDSGDSEVAAEAAAASAAVPDIQPAHIGVLVSSAARLAFATAHETGLVLRQLDNWAIRYRYVVCVATGCLLERYIHFFVQTNGPRNPFGFS